MSNIKIYTIEEGGGFWLVIYAKQVFKNLGYHYDSDFKKEIWEVLMQDMKAMCELSGATALPYWIDLSDLIQEKMTEYGWEDEECETLERVLKESPEVLNSATPTLWHPEAPVDERGDVGCKRYFKVVLSEHYESFDETETILVSDDVDGTATPEELIDAALVDLWDDALLDEPPDRQAFWYEIKGEGVNVTYDIHPIEFGQYNRIAGAHEVFEPTPVEVLRGKAYRAGEPPEFWHDDYLPQLPTAQFFEDFHDGRYYRLDYTITGGHPLILRGEFSMLFPYLAAHAKAPEDPTMAELTEAILGLWFIETGYPPAAMGDYTFRCTVYNAIGKEYDA